MAVAGIQDETVKTARDSVLALYKASGATDAVSKSPEFTKKVLDAIAASVMEPNVNSASALPDSSKRGPLVALR